MSMNIMTSLLYTTAILWAASCVSSSTEQSPVPVSARVGSTAVLPCELGTVSGQSPQIEWYIYSGKVFERYGQETHQGEGYEGRVDVPEDKLLKGDCSLVLRNIRATDAGVYKSFLVEKTKVPIQSVELSVDESLEGHGLFPHGHHPPTDTPGPDHRHLQCCTRYTEKQMDYSLQNAPIWKRNDEQVVLGTVTTGNRMRLWKFREMEGALGFSCQCIPKRPPLQTSPDMAVNVTTSLLYTTTLMCFAACVDSRIFMSARVGSSAVLPCDWRNVSSSHPHVEWRTISETVFERQGEDLYQGEGYEDRVDVPEDKLLKGNCSLVLKNIRPGDAGVYESFLLVSRKKRSLRSKRVLIQSVELSVDETPEESFGEKLAAPIAEHADADDAHQNTEPAGTYRNHKHDPGVSTSRSVPGNLSRVI
ncbi:hypothetical protein NFI96_015061, partial [Prochilodus magdalenae]